MSAETVKNTDEIFVFPDMSYQGFPHSTDRECVVLPAVDIDGLSSKCWVGGVVVFKSDDVIAIESAAISQAETYQTRIQEYGSFGDQLDEIFHDIDAWRLRIAAIKTAYPV